MPSERNYDGIQHEDIRKIVDSDICIKHDELDNCYYNGLPYKDYGVLDKSTFDKLHGLVFHQHTVAFHTLNKLRSVNKRIGEDKYRYDKDENGTIMFDHVQAAMDKIKELKAEGFVLK